MDPLFGARLKIEVANEKIDALEASLLPFASLESHEIVVEIDAEDNSRIKRAKHPKPVDPRWSVAIGEIVHNLRAPLDYVVHALAVSRGRPAVNKKRQFPICENLGEWHGHMGRKRIDELTPVQIAIIESSQPFVVSSKDPKRSWLFLLRELNNGDKHRLLQTSRRSVASGAVYFPIPRRGGEASMLMGGDVKDGTILARIPIDYALVDAEVTELEVCFANTDTSLDRTEIVHALRSMSNNVSRVVDMLAPTLSVTP